MQIFEEAISRAWQDGESILIPCTDKSSQESTRVMMFHLRKRLVPKKFQDTVGISKYEYKGQYFVRVYPRDAAQLFEIGPDGVPVIVKLREDTSERDRIVELMRVDGKSEEEIKAFLEGE